MVSTTEIAPEIYRTLIFVPEINLEFSHFLVRDEEPLLFHAGLRGMFPLLRQEISRLMDPSKLRHVGFSHFESDECGGLNEWLQIAPSAEPVCGLVGALVSVNDFAIRPARALTRDDVFSTGRYSFRFIPTPHVPHGWDAGVLSLRNRNGHCSAPTSSINGDEWSQQPPAASSNDVRKRVVLAEAGPFANYVPYTPIRVRVLQNLAEYDPKTLATMHGSSYTGDGAQALRDLATVMRDVLGPKAEQGTTSTGTVGGD